jgi:hypothetical protein
MQLREIISPLLGRIHCKKKRDILHITSNWPLLGSWYKYSRVVGISRDGNRYILQLATHPMYHLRVKKSLKTILQRVNLLPISTRLTNINSFASFQQMN